MLFILIPQIAFAAGERDPNFGNAGVARVNFSEASLDFVRDAALQADGKIVLVGDSTPTTPGSQRWVVARLSTDGTLDANFGNGGLVITDLDNQSTTPERAYSVAIQPDGKILVAGSATTLFQSNLRSVFGIVRYNANGSLDTSFGSGGKVYTDLTGNNSESVQKILIQSDGRIIAFGGIYDGANGNRIVLVRYKADGREDDDFRNPSRLIVSNAQEDAGFADAVIQQPGDKILIAGHTNYTYLNCGAPAICQSTFEFLTRYNSNFILDRKFGRRFGKELFGNRFDESKSVSLTSDGKILVGGTKIYRFSANGRFETVFTQVSLTTTQVAQRPDGKFVGAGTVFPGGGNQNVTASLFNENGTLIGIDTIILSTYDICTKILVQPDGKFIVIGSASFPGENFNFFAVRYLNITP